MLFCDLQSIINDLFNSAKVIKIMQARILLFVSFLIISLQGCVYRMDIPQGNQIAQQKLEQLKTGMSRSQVEFLLGSAAINDQYHANQAHYVYNIYYGDKNISELKTMILTYRENVLVDINGDFDAEKPGKER